MATRARPQRIFAAVVATLFLIVLCNFPAEAASLPMTPQADPPPAPTNAPSPPITPPPVPSSVKVTINQIEDSKFPLVVAYVSASDGTGTAVQQLTGQNWQVLEDDFSPASYTVTQTVNLEEPLAVALAIDISGSMQGKSLDAARDGATSFLDVLGPRDLVELISFSNVVKVNVPFTTTKTFVARGIDNLRAGGDTSLYDAVIAAVRNPAQLGPGRKLTVLLTDGHDTTSKARLEDALAEIALRRVPVFMVGLGEDVDREVLDTIALKSGGLAVYAPSAADLTRAYRTIADQLRSQYAIAFSSRLRADNKEHRLVLSAGNGEGHGTFIAQQQRLWMDIAAPKSGQSIAGSETVVVSVASGSPAASIARVEYAVDGIIVGTSTSAPYTGTITGTTLQAGQHVLKVTAEDSAGNMVNRELNFSVPAPPTPMPPAATATARPAASQAAMPEPGNQAPLIPIASGVSVLLVAGAGALKIRRRRPKASAACTICGTLYAGLERCPTCDMEDRQKLRRRLYDIVGRGLEQRREGEEKPLSKK